MAIIELARRIIPDRARHAVAVPVRRFRNRRATGDRVRELWDRGLQEEIGFWRNWIATRGAGNRSGFDFRMAVDSPLQDYMRELMPHAGTRVRILDVGAGPVTSLGKVWPGHDVEIRAVDALAAEYAALFEQMGVRPPVLTEFCHSEQLTDLFEVDTFDLALASNTLDHSYDPMEAIRQMVAVTKPGGVALLEHHPNEAEHEGYAGMHQWNMDLVDGEALVWRPGERISITEELAPVASVSGTFDPIARGFGLITVTIVKHGVDT